jgi:hypothetical protein
MLPDVGAIKTIVTVAVGGAIEFPAFVVFYDENFLSRSSRRRSSIPIGVRFNLHRKQFYM